MGAGVVKGLRILAEQADSSEGIINALRAIVKGTGEAAATDAALLSLKKGLVEAINSGNVDDFLRAAKASDNAALKTLFENPRAAMILREGSKLQRGQKNFVQQLSDAIEAGHNVDVEALARANGLSAKNPLVKTANDFVEMQKTAANAAQPAAPAANAADNTAGQASHGVDPQASAVVDDAIEAGARSTANAANNSNSHWWSRFTPSGRAAAKAVEPNLDDVLKALDSPFKRAFRHLSFQFTDIIEFRRLKGWREIIKGSDAVLDSVETQTKSIRDLAEQLAAKTITQDEFKAAVANIRQSSSQGLDSAKKLLETQGNVYRKPLEEVQDLLTNDPRIKKIDNALKSSPFAGFPVLNQWAKAIPAALREKQITALKEYAAHTLKQGANLEADTLKQADALNGIYSKIDELINNGASAEDIAKAVTEQSDTVLHDVSGISKPAEDLLDRLEHTSDISRRRWREDREALHRSIYEGYYNPNTMQLPVFKPDGMPLNPEKYVYSIEHFWETTAKEGLGVPHPKALANNIMALYRSGYEQEALYALRYLGYRQGAKAGGHLQAGAGFNTIPGELRQEIITQFNSLADQAGLTVRAGADPHFKRFMESVDNVISEAQTQHSPSVAGGRASDRRWQELTQPWREAFRFPQGQWHGISYQWTVPNVTDPILRFRDRELFGMNVRGASQVVDGKKVPGELLDSHQISWWRTPAKLMTGGMGRKTTGAVAAIALGTWGIEKGTEALGWNGLDNKPGWNIGVDPFTPVIDTQLAVTSFITSGFGLAPNPVSGGVNHLRNWIGTATGGWTPVYNPKETKTPPATTTTTTPPTTTTTTPPATTTTTTPPATTTTTTPPATTTTTTPPATTTTPPATTTDPNAPAYIGPAAGSNAAAVALTPEQQLQKTKEEANRVAKASADYVENSRLATVQTSAIVEDIRKVQERARDNGGNPSAFDAVLLDAQRKEQEANVAYQAAVEANKQIAAQVPQIGSATLANLPDAQARLKAIQDQVRIGQTAAQQASKASRDVQALVSGNEELDNTIHSQRQEDRRTSITSSVDGGGNGLTSNLTKGMGGGPSILGQWANAAGDAIGGVRDWWSHDVAKAASRSQGGKMMYQAANVGLMGIGALLGISAWNSTIGALGGPKIDGGIKWAVVGLALLYALHGTSKTGDDLDRMAGRPVAQSYDQTGRVGNYAFGGGTVNATGVDGQPVTRTLPTNTSYRSTNMDGTNVVDLTTARIERETRQAALQAGSEGTSHVPTDMGSETYFRAVTVTGNDGKAQGTRVISFPAAANDGVQSPAAAVQH